MSVQRVNLNVTVFGATGSGKGVFLREMFVRKWRRVLSLDTTGETRDAYPESIGPYFGLDRLLAGIRQAAEAEKRTGAGWHLVGALEEHEYPRLFRLLAPPFDGRSPSLSAAVGGLAVECGEIDLIAPNGRAHPDVVSAWRRGRHSALSILCSTQRPASCARDVSANAHIIVCFAAAEPRDVEYVEDQLSRPVAEIVRRLPQYHAAMFVKRDRLVYLLDHNRQRYRTLDLWGADVAAPATKSPAPATKIPPPAAPPPRNSMGAGEIGAQCDHSGEEPCSDSASGSSSSSRPSPSS